MNKDYLKIVDAVGSASHGVDSTFSCSGDSNLPMLTRICFGSFTKSFCSKRKVDITVRMFKNIWKQGYYNCSKGVTPFTCEEIVQYLNDLRKIFPFEFEVEEKTIPHKRYENMLFSGRAEDTIDIIDVTYHIEGPHIAFMFILSLQRFLYAFGDSFYLALAFEVKNGGYGFDKMNLFNILNCVISTTHCRYMGNDMYHFNPENFVYLLNSKDFREMLLAREALAQQKYSDGCADLHLSMPYVNDSRLKRMRVDNPPRFTCFKEGNEDAKKEILNSIIFNLGILREYNGFGEKAKTKRDALAAKTKEILRDQINCYGERKDSDIVSVKTHIDETRLAE